MGSTLLWAPFFYQQNGQLFCFGTRERLAAEGAHCQLFQRDIHHLMAAMHLKVHLVNSGLTVRWVWRIGQWWCWLSGRSYRLLSQELVDPVFSLSKASWSGVSRQWLTFSFTMKVQTWVGSVPLTWMGFLMELHKSDDKERKKKHFFWYNENKGSFLYRRSHGGEIFIIPLRETVHVREKNALKGVLNPRM